MYKLFEVTLYKLFEVQPVTLGNEEFYLCSISTLKELNFNLLMFSFNLFLGYIPNRKNIVTIFMAKLGKRIQT